MSDIDERWQGYDEDGLPNNRALERDEAYDGSLHGAAHVWMWRVSDGVIEVVLQYRALAKQTWPGLWDISAAGHIDFGETPIAAAIRETSEETGVSVDQKMLKLLYVFRVYLEADGEKKRVENEFQFVYGCRLEKDQVFTMQDGEVEQMMWVTIDEFETIVAGKDYQERHIVPHPKEYFACLLREIRRQAAEE